MKVVCNNKTVAEGEPILLEGNAYFSGEDVDTSVLKESYYVTTCPLKGKASHYNIVLDDAVVQNAVWQYREPKEGYEEIEGSLDLSTSSSSKTDYNKEKRNDFSLFIDKAASFDE